MGYLTFISGEESMKVTKVWPHKHSSGKLMGFADVQFSLDGSDDTHMTWKGFKVFKGEKNSVEIGLPSHKDEKGKTDDNGKPVYYPVITIVREAEGGPGNDLLEHIRSEVEKAYFATDEKPAPKKSSASNSSGIDDSDVPF